jgi:hypothetical protein
MEKQRREMGSPVEGFEIFEVSTEIGVSKQDRTMGS